ncbi:hypothetical protein [Clostridium baratii]|uniref:hypothetical protein n=1 Tax=Clostridium baratii TaxID=1561 RepID=UPI0030CC1945
MNNKTLSVIVSNKNCYDFILENINLEKKIAKSSLFLKLAYFLLLIFIFIKNPKFSIFNLFFALLLLILIFKSKTIISNILTKSINKLINSKKINVYLGALNFNFNFEYSLILLNFDNHSLTIPFNNIKTIFYSEKYIYINFNDNNKKFLIPINLENKSLLYSYINALKNSYNIVVTNKVHDLLKSIE